MPTFAQTDRWKEVPAEKARVMCVSRVLTEATYQLFIVFNGEIHS